MFFPNVGSAALKGLYDQRNYIIKEKNMLFWRNKIDVGRRKNGKEMERYAPKNNLHKTNKQQNLADLIKERFACPPPLPLRARARRLPPSNDLVFARGAVELSFLISVHQDGETESSEFFDLVLYDPWGGARLGAQHRTRVTIVDAQTNSSTSDHNLTSFFLGGVTDEAGGGAPTMSWRERSTMLRL